MKNHFFSRWSSLLLIGCILLGWSPIVRAERVYIDITQPSFEPLPIAVPEFKRQTSGREELAGEMAGILTNDLNISGVFRLADLSSFSGNLQEIGVTKEEIQFEQWRKLGAEFLVRGSYQIKGSSLKLEMRLFDVVGAKLVVGKVYEGRIEDRRPMLHRFADEIFLVLTGERGIFETKIAFVQIQKNIKEINVVDFDGNNPVQITHDQSISLSPAWSPEGSRIAYVSYKDGSPKVYLLDLLKGSRQLLSGSSGLNISPAWRPGTNEMALTLSKDGNPDIYLLSSEGKVIRKLVDDWGIDVSPAWSPDGKYLAYVSSQTGNPQIYVLDTLSGKKHRITFEGKYNTSPSWSPKGDWIAYSGLNGSHHNIYIARVDGTEVRQLTHGEGSNESPCWSPDGRMLAFSSTREGNSAIWVVAVNGAGLRRLTNLPGSQELPDWSPYFKINK